MAFSPVQKLTVYRTLSTGYKVAVGVMAQNKQGVFFQYSPAYVSKFGNLSPFKLKSDNSLQLASKAPHNGMHGVFSDSLPDGWGLLLQDRVFRQHNILPAQITPMDRLAFVGESAIGALSFSPGSEYAQPDDASDNLAELGTNAQQLFDGQTEDVLSALIAAGSSGGTRPKAQIYTENMNFSQCSTQEASGNNAWIVKFTSKNLPLGHEEGLFEAVYLTLAEKAGLQPPQWTLLDAPEKSEARKWLAVKRFDFIASENGKSGRYHMLSACGLLDEDFRVPSLDYDDLIRASRVLCKSPAAGRLQFKRAIFNLFACNQDDHSKNWAFLQNDQGNWQPAPFYDVTFSPTAFNEHTTSYAGFGKSPTANAIKTLAQSAGFIKWEQTKLEIQKIVEIIATFPGVAEQLGAAASSRKLIARQLQETRKTLFTELALD